MWSLGSRTPSEARALTASPRLPALVRAIALFVGSNDLYLRMILGLVHKALNFPDLNRVINYRILEVAVRPSSEVAGSNQPQEKKEGNLQSPRFTI